MTTKEKMRRFQAYKWTSQMVANSRKQGEIRYIHNNITDCGASIRYIMDVSQGWSGTPQGREYWSRIKSCLYL